MSPAPSCIITIALGGPGLDTPDVGPRHASGVTRSPATKSIAVRAQNKRQGTNLMMQSRAARAVTNAVVAAGTAGTIASVYWLLNRIVDGDDYKCIKDSPTFFDTEGTTTDEKYDKDYSDDDHEVYHTDRFTKLPVIAEADDELTEDATGYTGDYYTPSFDICMLSVNIETLVDSFSNGTPSKYRLGGAVEDGDFAIDCNGRLHTLSFLDTDCRSNGSDGAAARNDCEEKKDFLQRASTSFKTKQWLYVRL